MYPSTSTVILGDSVVAALHQLELVVDSKQWQVLSFSGLATTKLLTALHGEVSQPEFTIAALHIALTTANVDTISATKCGVSSTQIPLVQLEHTLYNYGSESVTGAGIT